MFAIQVSQDAERHLAQMRVHDRRVVLHAIESQLDHEPSVPSRNRMQLRRNPLASWELRAGDFRVFYNVDVPQSHVIIVAIGRKRHNVLTIDGKEYAL